MAVIFSCCIPVGCAVRCYKKRGICCARYIFSYLCTPLRRKRGLDEKLQQTEEKKVLFFFLEDGKVFLPLHSASEEGAEVLKREKRER